MPLSILAVSDAQCNDISIYNRYKVLNKDESVCFNVSAFIQINGNNTIVQKKGEEIEKTFINKTNIFSIQLDGSLSTTITCTDSSGKCSYNAYIIDRSFPAEDINYFYYDKIPLPLINQKAFEFDIKYDYTVKSYLALSPVDAYVEKNSSLIDSKTHVEMSSIKYILPEAQEYYTVYPDVPCGPDSLRRSSYQETDFVFHSFKSRPTLKRIFKKVEFTKKKEGKIREVPSQNGLYEFDNQPEYDRNNEELYSVPYKCEAFSEYGLPFVSHRYGKCHIIIYADDEKENAIYPRTLKAKPGESFCIENSGYTNFMVDSNQNYTVEIYNNGTQIYEKPFIVAPEVLTYKKLTCTDEIECNYQFSIINAYGYEFGNVSVYVTLNKDLSLEGTLNATYFPENKKKQFPNI